MATHLHLLCFDLSLPWGYSEDRTQFIHQLRKAAEEFGNNLCSVKSPDHRSFVAVLMQDLAPQVLLRTSEFSLPKFYSTLETFEQLALQSVASPSVDRSNSFLEYAQKFASSEKQLLGPVSPHLVYVSAQIWTSGVVELQLRQLHEDDFSLDYFYVMAPKWDQQTSSDECLNTDLASFLVLMKHYSNFRVTKVKFDDQGFQKCFLAYFQSIRPEKKLITILTFPSSDFSIVCSQEDLTAGACLRPTKVCGCHHLCLDTFHPPDGKPRCPNSRALLEQSYAHDAAKIGTSIFQCTPFLPLDKTLHLIIEEQLSLSSVSESYFLGPSCILSFNVLQELDWRLFKTNKYKFWTLCKTLDQLNMGLLAYSTNTDLSGARIFPDLKNYYILIPSTDWSYFIAREVAAREHLLIPHQHVIDFNEVPDTVTDSVTSALAMVPSKDFDPTQHSNNSHNKISQLMKEQPQPPAQKPRSVQSNELISLGPQQTPSSRFQRDQPKSFKQTPVVAPREINLIPQSRSNPETKSRSPVTPKSNVKTYNLESLGSQNGLFQPGEPNSSMEKKLYSRKKKDKLL